MGRNLARNGDAGGLAHFKTAFDLALEIPHPAGMITSLNALAWYGQNYDIRDASDYSEEALYIMGKYYESPQFYIFDTAFDVMKKAENAFVYEVSKDLFSIYETLSPEVRKKYKNTLSNVKNFLSISEYAIDGKITRFLRKLKKTIIFSGSQMSRSKIS